MSLMNVMKKTLDGGVSITENGMIGYSTSGSKLVDLNFAVSSARNWDEEEIIDAWKAAYEENSVGALTWLFYAGDIRGGLGERRLFRIIYRYLLNSDDDFLREFAIDTMKYIAEYNRWDSLIYCAHGTVAWNAAMRLILSQIGLDIRNMNEGNHNVSLLAKWLPSENTKNKKVRKVALDIIKWLNWSPKKYRQVRTSLNKYIDTVEIKMCGKKWDEIDYSKVPSKANLNYTEAFMKNDTERRLEYIDKLTSGKAKINSSVLFPHDIVHKIAHNYDETDESNALLDEMWKGLPDYTVEGSRILSIVDGSGSMTMYRLGNTNITPWEVANGLGIYYAEKFKGEFHNKFITFSSKPEIVELNENWSIVGKVYECRHHDDCTNTNIEAVFDLILNAATRANLTQDDLPTALLIVSDMEFDGHRMNGSANVFEVAAKRFEACGYKLPKLIFWNVCSRTNTIPVRENENGVILVSGFSLAITKMVVSQRLNPADALYDILNGDRYKQIRDIIFEAIETV